MSTIRKMGAESPSPLAPLKTIEHISVAYLVILSAIVLVVYIQGARITRSISRVRRDADGLCGTDCRAALSGKTAIAARAAGAIAGAAKLVKLRRDIREAETEVVPAT